MMTGPELRVWRERQDISLDDAAELFDVKRRELAEIEAGQKPVPASVMSHVLDGAVEPLPDVIAVPSKLAGVVPLVFDPEKEGLVRGPISNTEFGASKSWDDRVLGPKWQRVEDGIRVVSSLIPRPINWVPPRTMNFWAGEDGVITADGRVFHNRSGEFLGNFHRDTGLSKSGLKPGSLANTDKKYRR